LTVDLTGIDLDGLPHFFLGITAVGTISTKEILQAMLKQEEAKPLGQGGATEVGEASSHAPRDIRKLHLD
jgi:hypothetical protein